MKRSENLNSIYVLLFLTIAFYFFQVSDPERYASFFSFQRDRVLSGEIWRLVTYQFLQAGALSFFFSLLMLYILGSALEERWGTVRFLAFVLISVITTAAIGFVFNFGLLGSYVDSYSLLFAFAYVAPNQTFMIFPLPISVKVKWLAYIAAGILLITAVLGSSGSIAAAGGAALSLFYAISIERGTTTSIRRAARIAEQKVSAAASSVGEEKTMSRNAERYAAVKKTITGQSAEDRDALIRELEPQIVPGVNICPPADFKPEHSDQYCVRCEGFAECSIRYLGQHAAVFREPTDPSRAADSGA